LLVRARIFFGDELLPQILHGHTVLVIAHADVIRALRAVIDELSEEEAEELRVSPDHPLLYVFGHDLAPALRGGRYLDEHVAQLATAHGGTGIRPALSPTTADEPPWKSS
jgi:2,3-bisphosphoglycerate-dependent phosphoglycerate mutase